MPQLPQQSGSATANDATQPAVREPHADLEAHGGLRRSELALVLCFLVIIASVPVVQTLIELAEGGRVQFTDVFREPFTAKNLRQYELTLKEKSWFQNRFRPLVQLVLFNTLGDTGAKAVCGRDQWHFYRPDVRYVIEPNRVKADPGDSKWALPRTGQTHRDSVVSAIEHFSQQLKERNITLVVVPAPGKPSVYPDQVTARLSGRASQVRSPTGELLAELRRRGIATVDLFACFDEARSASTTLGGGPLYLAQDTHWTPAGAKLAAQAIAEKLREMKLAPEPSKSFRLEPVTVLRWGDVLEMTQIPGLRGVFAMQSVQCEQVIDSALGPMVPTPSDRPGTFRYPGQASSILMLGDSFCRIYQYAEPQSLGEVVPKGESPARAGETKRLLPGSAGVVSHLAAALQAPVDAIYSDGGASTDVRRKLSTNPEILEGKKVVVWEFVERDIALGREGWEEVPLPRRLDANGP